MKIKVSYIVDVDIDAWAEEYGATKAEAGGQVMVDLVSWAPLYLADGKWEGLVSMDPPGVLVQPMEEQ